MARFDVGFRYGIVRYLARSARENPDGADLLRGKPQRRYRFETKLYARAATAPASATFNVDLLIGSPFGLSVPSVPSVL